MATAGEGDAPLVRFAASLRSAEDGWEYAPLRLLVDYDSTGMHLKRLLAEALGIPKGHLSLHLPSERAGVGRRIRDSETLRDAGVLLGCEPSRRRRRRGSRAWRANDVLARVGELFTAVPPAATFRARPQFEQGAAAFEGDVLLFSTRHALRDYLRDGKFHRRRALWAGVSRVVLGVCLCCAVCVLWFVSGYKLAPLSSLAEKNSVVSSVEEGVAGGTTAECKVEAVEEDEEKEEEEEEGAVGRAISFVSHGGSEIV